jgi:pyruvate-ferredoxin/flavodoxin oxidoreductase
MEGENRFRLLGFHDPERARALARQAETERDRRLAMYRALAAPQAAPEVSR